MPTQKTLASQTVDQLYHVPFLSHTPNPSCLVVLLVKNVNVCCANGGAGAAMLVIVPQLSGV